MTQEFTALGSPGSALGPFKAFQGPKLKAIALTLLLQIPTQNINKLCIYLVFLYFDKTKFNI